MKNSNKFAAASGAKRLPEWLKQHISLSDKTLQIKQLLREHKLHTVCQSAGCPNISHCFQKSTATFMILGNVCTRHCTFCGVSQGQPLQVDFHEPEHIADAVIQLDLKHVVITSVTRDDLVDGGASQFYKTVRAIKAKNPQITVETLIPDFQGNEDALKHVLASGVDVLNHNVETVPRLYTTVRPEADFKRSIRVLEIAKMFQKDMITKSGMMFGLGETKDEVIEVFEALLEVECDALTLGQYISPGHYKTPVKEFLHPVLFDRYRDMAQEMGFRFVKSGPFVRSSFEAEELIKMIRGAIT